MKINEPTEFLSKSVSRQQGIPGVLEQIFMKSVGIGIFGYASSPARSRFAAGVFA
jgi:hypothetical protein